MNESVRTPGRGDGPGTTPSPQSRRAVSQLDYNPFAARLRDTENEIEELQHRRAGMIAQASWAAQFNGDEARAELTSLRSALEKCTAELTRLDEHLSELESKRRLLVAQVPGLEFNLSVGLSIGRWYTQRREHKREVVALRQRCHVASAQRDQVAREHADLTDRVLELEQALTRFAGYRSEDADEALAEIDAELQLARERRDRLEDRTTAVDCAVEGPLAELRKYESEVRDRESAISKLKSELSHLDGKIADAERIDRKLSSASTKRDRAVLHEECERRFGVGSPGRAIGALRSQMRPLTNSVRDHEREIARIGRDITKTEQRIMELAAVAARHIDSLIIDGNNCCYQGGDFIGLAALIPMTRKLAGRFAVTVIFDAGIRGRLGVGDDNLRAALPDANVHVVASRSKADATILDTADEPTSWVISNDRFGEFRDKMAVKEGRIIRHEIVRGRILVHDLDINEPLSALTETSDEEL